MREVTVDNRGKKVAGDFSKGLQVSKNKSLEKQMLLNNNLGVSGGMAARQFEPEPLQKTSEDLQT